MGTGDWGLGTRGQGETALLVGFPTPVAHGGDPQDRAGSSAGDCVSRSVSKGDTRRGTRGWAISFRTYALYKLAIV
jgi:hypothetical protein